MAASAGWKAIVQIGGTPTTITGLKTADLSVSTDIYDITNLNNNQWKLKLGGLTDYTLKLAGNYDMSDAEQQALQAAIITTPGTSVSWTIFPTGTGGHSYSGTAFIKGFNPKFAVNAELQISFDLEGSGSITYS